LTAGGCGRTERDAHAALVAVAPVASSLGTLLSLPSAAGARAAGTLVRRNAAAHADRCAMASVGRRAPAATTARPTLRA